MAMRFGDSFDGYDTAQILEKWTTVSNPGSTAVINTVNQRNGRGCMQVKAGGLSKTVADFTLGTSGCAMYFTAQGGGIFFAADGNIGVELVLRNDGRFNVQNGGGGPFGVTDALYPLALNQYYYVELQSGYGIAATIIVKVNGRIVGSFTGDTRLTGFPAFDQVGLQGPGGGSVVYCDDFYFNDGTGGVNDSFLGNIVCGVIVADGPGNYTDFTPFPGAPNWSNTNEIPPDGDTSYNFSNVTDDRDSYTFQDVSLLPSYFAVQVTATMKQDGIGTIVAENFTRIGGTDYPPVTPAVDYNLGSDYNGFLSQYQVNPDTGVAWTAADINGAEFGVHLKSVS
jgi:hypothetical protein